MGTRTPVVSWEIRGNDMATLRAFYGGLFDWNLGDDETARYTPVDGTDIDDGFGLSGGIGAGRGEPWVTIYVRVPDLAATVEEVERLGGAIVRGITHREGAASFAIVKDPEGHVLGLAQA